MQGSLKWIGADSLVYRLRIAAISAVMVGSGTTVTHAAMWACANCNTPICSIGVPHARSENFIRLSFVFFHTSERVNHFFRALTFREF